MRPRVRQAEIAEIVRHQRQATVEELAARFGTSHETIRRDLTALADDGTIRKVHGGARLPTAAHEGPFAERMTQNAAAKRRIAVKAAALVAPGQTIFIDTGSTTLACAEEIAKVAGLTVITNSARIAEVISGGSGRSTVFLLGGRFENDNRETVGPMATAAIGAFHADHALITIGALDADLGAMDYDFDEAQIARAMIDNANAVMVVADASKFGRRASFKVCPLERIQTLVSENPPVGGLRDALTAAKVSVQ